MKELFIVFKKKGIKYNYKYDFNANGKFHGVVMKMWDEAKQKDPNFGTNQHRAYCDEEADVKIRVA